MITAKQSERRYFDTLDAVRFFGFTSIFIAHMPVLNHSVHDIVLPFAMHALKLFFTLSGFLITYLILEEKERTGKLNLKHFFIRRILKIVPLCYLMILFAYSMPYILDMVGLTSPPGGYEPRWYLSVTFLENYKMIFENQRPNVSPLAVMWSLCVEEHFYIIWGVVFYFMKTDKTPYFIGVCILISIISKLIFLEQGWSRIDVFTNLDTFAIGAIPAYLLVKKKDKFEKTITGIPYKIRISIIILIVFAFFFVPVFEVSLYVNEILFSIIFCALYSILFAFFAPKDNNIKIGKTNIFSRLGKYAYGLYLYHTTVLNLFLQLFVLMNINLDTFSGYLLYFVLSYSLVITVSIISYHVYEVKFLRLKKRFLK
jgi:Predicted acyltransferases